jgi:enoyl-CoA hydratase/carnithine racemase
MTRPYRTIRFAARGPIAIVTLDRPKVLNAYDVAMRDDLFAVLSAVDDDPTLRVLVLRGAGRAFSAGGDLTEFGSAPSPVVARAVRFQRDVWGRLLAVRAATIAAVHGRRSAAAWRWRSSATSASLRRARASRCRRPGSA